MRRTILIIISIALTTLFFSLIYLSTYGVKTDNFNTFIDTKVKEYNSKLNLKLDAVFIKLNLLQGSININTKDAILIAENNEIKILNTDINLNIIKFIKKENSIKDIKIQTSENSIKRVTSLFNSINFDQSRYALYNQIKKGLIKFKLEAKFDNVSQKINSYRLSGSIEEAKFNLLDNDSFNEIKFNFDTKDKLIKISNLNFRYQNLNFESENVEINVEKSDLYSIKGDIESFKGLINPNVLFKLANIKQDFVELL